MKRNTTAAALLLLLSGSAKAALADNSVSIRAASSWISDGSLDAVSDNNHVAQAELTYARRLLSLSVGELWGDAAYAVGRTEAEMFGGQARGSALLQNVTLGVRYALPVLKWIVPYGRLGLGVGVGTLALANLEAGSEVQDRAAGLAGHLLLGCELLWPRRALLSGRSALTAGLVIEGGYAFGTRLGFDLAPSGDKDLRQIPVDSVDVGGLSTSGWQLRVGGVLRF